MMNRPATVSQNLRCPLTDAEKIRFGESLARLLDERSEVEDEKTAVAARFKAQLEGIEKAATKAHRVLSAGYEFRWIDCKVLYHDPGSRQKTLVRLDTGEIVRVEDMSEEECQENLPLTVHTVAEAIEQRLPEINQELQANAPEGVKVELTLENPIVEHPIATAAKESAEHTNGKRKRGKPKTDPQAEGQVYPV